MTGLLRVVRGSLKKAGNWGDIDFVPTHASTPEIRDTDTTVIWTFLTRVLHLSAVWHQVGNSTSLGMGCKLTSSRIRSRTFPFWGRCAPGWDLMSFSGVQAPQHTSPDSPANCEQIMEFHKLWFAWKAAGSRKRKSCRKPCIVLKATMGSLGHVL